MTTLRPVSTPGAWEQEASYRARAEDAQRLFLDRAVELDQILSAATGRRLDQHTRRVLNEMQFLADSVVIFTAMTVESFLNHYGVRRLGEDYFDGNLERQSTARKATSLIALTTGILLPSSDELLITLRRIASRRSALVHPKTREVRPGREALPLEPPRDRVQASIHDMRRTFELYIRPRPGSGWL